MKWICMAMCAAAALSLPGLSCRERNSGSADTSFVIKVYSEADTGFGYAVYQGGRKLIDQPHIPAVQHRLCFRTAAEAQHIAMLARQKLQAHEFPPAISIRELDSLRIHY